MMTLKYPEPAVYSHRPVCLELSLFSLPPQGAATISATDARALDELCRSIRKRLSAPVTLTVHPHRIGGRTSVALHMEGRLGRCIDLLVSVGGNTLWPELEEYNHPRWYITVPDTADMVYLLLLLSETCEQL